MAKIEEEKVNTSHVLVLWLSLVVFSATGRASAQTSFYHGKTMTYVVGLLPGDSTDLWARSVMRNMMKHVPGKPNVVVQNMPGAGGLIAANYIYGVAKPMGSRSDPCLPGIIFTNWSGVARPNSIGGNSPG